jgi:hypothetical protein
MLRYEPKLRPRAIAFLDSCPEAERRLLLDLIEQIALDPVRNERTKIALMLPPVVYTVYVGHPDYWIVYSYYTVQGRPVLSVSNISRPSDKRPRP